MVLCLLVVSLIRCIHAGGRKMYNKEETHKCIDNLMEAHKHRHDSSVLKARKKLTSSETYFEALRRAENKRFR